MSKTIRIVVDLKRSNELSQGHTNHRSGSGPHECRPRKLRTRKNLRDFYIKEQIDDVL